MRYRITFLSLTFHCLLVLLLVNITVAFHGINDFPLFVRPHTVHDHELTQRQQHPLKHHCCRMIISNRRLYNNARKIVYSSSSSSSTATTNSCPDISPATGLRNQFYTWKNNQQIRYQCSSPVSSSTKTGTLPILFIHGLFTNSDHWRHTLKYFQSSSLSTKYTAYAIDLFGCGYSDKPLSDSTIAQSCNGEYHRFDYNKDDMHRDIQPNVILGTANGQRRMNPVDVKLRHPLGSPYNFYTWADVIADFCKDIILPAHSINSDHNDDTTSKVTLVCNSIGTISSLQAVLDHTDIFNGVFVISPNFRELHSAEVPIPSITMPIVRFQQGLLRNYIGQSLFTQLAKPNIVRDILKVPYAVKDMVDDELVQVLLHPLLTPGASNVVFDTLSYSAGPLPEPQLQQISHITTGTHNTIPIWVCYGSDDPWTPGERVEALQSMSPNVVQKVICLPGVGHCPHDEAPDMVHPLLLDFLHNAVPVPETTCNTK